MEDVERLECEHEFHHDCITQWLTYTHACPICRHPIISTIEITHTPDDNINFADNMFPEDAPIEIASVYLDTDFGVFVVRTILMPNNIQYVSIEPENINFLPEFLA